jgi:hypothetical protein
MKKRGGNLYPKEVNQTPIKKIMKISYVLKEFLF